MSKLKKKEIEKPAAQWTRFMDMHSGGGTKEPPYEYIYIEAPEDEAKVIFYKRFGHNPERVSCTCCGDDYSISSEADLAQATAYNRNCKWDEATERYVEKQEPRNISIRENCSTATTDPWGLYMTVDEYLKSPNVLIIRYDEIKTSERKGSIPSQGYIWVD